MCQRRWELYMRMSRSYYNGSDPLKYAVYERAKLNYSRHIFYCQECRTMLEMLTEIAQRQQLADDMDARLEAWAKERGVE